MSQVPIEKAEDGSAKALAVLDEITKQFEAIERRAFDLFERRGCLPGNDREDWLEAERDLAWSPATELVDEGKRFKARLALPGLDAKDVHVTAMRDTLIVEGGATHTHEEKDGSVCFCEFSRNKLFRRLALPASIDVDKVSASLDKGILLVTAPKAGSKQVPVETHRAPVEA
jgi:HSP20 family protein